mmetsp:Transcript_9785/g.24913  ORF Transcript_9785/g.24913 Transcript_9785/m.24913 type:complete len:244 (+) Transcript_9785:392-1123(+)
MLIAGVIALGCTIVLHSASRLLGSSSSSQRQLSGGRSGGQMQLDGALRLGHGHHAAEALIQGVLVRRKVLGAVVVKLVALRVQVALPSLRHRSGDGLPSYPQQVLLGAGIDPEVDRVLVDLLVRRVGVDHAVRRLHEGGAYVVGRPGAALLDDALVQRVALLQHRDDLLLVLCRRLLHGLREVRLAALLLRGRHPLHERLLQRLHLGHLLLHRLQRHLDLQRALRQRPAGLLLFLLDLHVGGL